MFQSDLHKIIILDENQLRRDYLRSLIFGWGYLPFCFEKLSICLDNLTSINPDLIISGPLFLGRTFRFIYALKTINSILPVILISDDHAVQDFINTNGFTDVFVIDESFEAYDIKAAISRIQTDSLKRKTHQDCPLIIGQHPSILDIKKVIPEVSRSNETVLIQGETGAGKELVAKAIHYRSDRRNNPFIKADFTGHQCRLFESEIFGGNTLTPTGACKNNKEKIEDNCRGTIFIDEITNINGTSLSALFHLLDQGNTSKFGQNGNKKNDVRIIAASKTNLCDLVKRGKFRKDLYYRLNSIGLEILPLRSRIEDIPLLTGFFTDKFCREYGKSYYELSKKTFNSFLYYSWPGNVEELENVVKSLVLLADENNIVDNLNLYYQKSHALDFTEPCEKNYTFSEFPDVKYMLMGINKTSLKAIRKEFTIRAEKKIVKKALERTNWNRKKAAALLDISYKSLLNKIKAYNVA
jgi:DNA-binding NtrC family response regulator